jgi:carboxylesterase type B
MTGLFHRAIAQSGSALCPWAAEDPAVARTKAFRLGMVLGCKTSDSKELVEFLMKVPAQELTEATDKVFTESVSVKSFIVIIWLIVGLCNIKTSIKAKIIYTFSICSQHYATVTITVLKLNAEFF